MSDPPLVSIIISSYNYEAFLPASIDSALSQTYSRVEVVVVDDASTDRSREIILRYGNRVSPVFRETTEGQNHIVNTGLALANGEFIIFLDSDDTIFPGAVEQAVQLFQNPEVVKVHWPLQVIDSGGTCGSGVRPPVPLPDGDFRCELARKGPFHHPAPPTSGNAYSRRFLQSVLPVPDDAYDDAFLAMWALASGQVKRIEEPQGSYRLHGKNHYEYSGFDRRLEGDLRHGELCVQLLNRHYRERGVEADTALWKADAWCFRLFASVDEIKQLVPEGELFILADLDTWATRGEVAGRRCVPLPERNGEYGGKPLDSEDAIRQVMRLLRAGASLLVFAWPAFWWLDHYDELRTYLDATFPCVLRNERLIAFDLSSA